MGWSEVVIVGDDSINVHKKSLKKLWYYLQLRASDHDNHCDITIIKSDTGPIYF